MFHFSPPLLLGDTAPGQLYITVPQLAAVALLAGGVIMLTWAFRRGTGGGQAGAVSGGPPRTRGVRNSDGQPSEPLGSYMADARELADLLADRLDRQAQRLERLLAEADDKIRRLERLKVSAGGDRGSEAALPGGMAAKPESDPLNRRVYELADSGLPPVEIARTLQQHTGKVELILALRRR